MNKKQTLFQRFVHRVFHSLVARLARHSSPDGHLEVERKFRITDEEAASLPAQIAKLGFAPGDAVTMTDTFLPVEREGDMARIRDEKQGSCLRSMLTLKSWVVTPDGGKERSERECGLRPGIRSLLLYSGRLVNGGRLMSFSKHRQHFNGLCDGRQAVVAIDSVGGLGRHSGFYLEVEVLVPAGEDVQAARLRISEIASNVLGGEREQVRLSYQDMLRQSAEEQVF